MKFKYLLFSCMYLLMAIDVYADERKFRKDMTDLNTDIIISIETRPEPEQFLNRGMGDKLKNLIRFPNFGVKPIQVMQGAILQLKVEVIDNNGIRKDITYSKDVHVFSTFYKFHLCQDMKICVWPSKESSDNPYDARFGEGDISVTYYAQNGKLKGFNGVNLKVNPDPKFNKNNLPSGSIIESNPPIKPSTLKTQPVTDQTWQQIKKLKGIATQSGIVTPSLYVFFDPNCPYCTSLWKTVLPVKPNTGAKPAEIQKAEFFNSVPAIWIPVAYINDTSLGKSAALLRANSHSSIDSNFQTAKYKEKQGGAVAVVPTASETTALAQAKALWLELGGATPLTVYRNKEGGTKLFLGVPSDDQLKELLSQVGASSLPTYISK